MKSHHIRTAALHESARGFGKFIINLKVSILHWNEELLEAMSSKELLINNYKFCGFKEDYFPFLVF